MQPTNCTNKVNSYLFIFGMKPRFCTTWRVYFVWEISRLRIRSLINQWSRYGKRDTACIHKCAATTFINCMKMYGLRDIPNGKAVNWIPGVRKWNGDISWILDVSEHEDMHPSRLWRQPNHWPLSIVLLNWLSPSWNDVCSCTDLVAKDLLLVVTFLSFLVLGIAGSKNHKPPGFRTLSTARFLRSSAISSCNNGEEQPIWEELTWKGSWTHFGQ